MVPGGSTIWSLSFGIETELSGIRTSSSGGRTGTVSSSAGTGDRSDPSGCAGGAGTGDWLAGRETGELSDPSDGIVGAPYMGAGRRGGDNAMGMGGAYCSTRGVTYCGDATADVISVRKI
jgi:hypothetical protein